MRESIAPRPFWTTPKRLARPPTLPATRPVMRRKVKKCSEAKSPDCIKAAPLKMTSVIAPKMNKMMKLAKAPRPIAPFIANCLTVLILPV